MSNQPLLLSESLEETGTTVLFTNLVSLDKEKIVQTIKEEFFWFLELNKKHNYEIIIDSIPLVYEDIVEHREKIDISELSLSHSHEIEFIHWKISLGNEFSRFYFIDSNNHEQYKETTKLNKKSDNFHHSVYLSSDYWNDFSFEPLKMEGQQGVFPNRTSDEFKVLCNYLNIHLTKFRKDF